MAVRIPQTQMRRVAPEVVSAPRVAEASVDSSGLARGVSNLAANLDDVYRREVQEAEQTFAIDTDSKATQQANALTFNPDTGILSKKGGNALGSTAAGLKEWDTYAQGVLDNAATPKQRQIAGRILANQRSQLENRWSSHEFQEQQAYKNGVDAGAIATAQNDAALKFNDPAAIDQAKLKIDGILELQGQRNGWSPELLAANRQKNMGKMFSGVIKNALTKSTSAGQSVFDRYRSEMDSDSQVRASDWINTSQRRDEAEARQRQIEARQLQAISRAELQSRIQDANAAALNGFVPGDAPTLADFRASYGNDDQAKSAYASFQKVQAVAPVAQELHSAPMDQWPQILQTFDKTHDGVAGPGFKEDLEIQRHVSRVADNISKERQSDPASYVARYSPSVQQAFTQAQQDGSPESYKKYINASLAEQERLGVRDPKVLPSGAAQAIGDNLKKGDPDQQAKALENLYEQYGQYYPSVLEQVGGDSPAQVVAGMVGSANKNVQTRLSGVFTQGVSRSPEFVQKTILTGHAALRDKSYKLPPSTNASGQVIAGPDKAFYDAANGLLDPSSMKTYREAYQSYYAGLAIQNGKYGEAFERDYASEALKAIGLNPVEIGTGKTLPPYGMDGNTFKDKISRAFDDYKKGSGIDKSLSDLTIYAGPNSMYLLRDALGNRITELKVSQ